MSEKQTILEEYLLYTKEHSDKYGERTVVLLHCGKFYEIYGFDDSSGNVVGSRITDVASTCDLRIAKKAQTFAFARSTLENLYGRDSVEYKTFHGRRFDYYMAGFQTDYIDRYVNMLVQDGWTVPVYKQNGTSASATPITRELLQVFTPGTTFSEDDVSVSNNLVCVWIAETKPSLVLPRRIRLYGCVSLDIYTGKVSVGEFSVRPVTQTISDYDDVAHFIAVEAPSEVRVIVEPDRGTRDDLFEGLKRALGPTAASYRQVEATPEIMQFTKQTVQDSVLERFFPQAVSADSCILSDVRGSDTALAALTYLLTSVSSQAPALIDKLHAPKLSTSANELVLANHSLQQLNIVGTQKRGAMSVSELLLGKTTTAMGRRQMKNALFHPSVDTVALQRSYDSTEVVLASEVDITRCCRILRSVGDLEKMYRKLVLGRATLTTVHNLDRSIRSVQTLLDLCDRGGLGQAVRIIDIVGESTLDAAVALRGWIDSNFDTCFLSGDVREIDFRDRIFLASVDTVLDTTILSLAAKRSVIDDAMITISEGVSGLKRGNPKFKKVVEEHTPGSGNTPLLQTTKRRAICLSKSQGRGLFQDADGGTSMLIKYSAFTAHPRGSGDKRRLSHPWLDKLLSGYHNGSVSVEEQNQRVFAARIAELVDMQMEFECISAFVGSLDMLITRVRVANEFSFCKPTVVERNEDHSPLIITGLRHPLIERVQEHEMYVTNDLSFEEEERGMLLFGTNAVGKSSLVKAVGIAVVLAQAGMYVPASTMTYSPYTQLFTRILGNDDLFRGLSTFAVEMVELNSILRRADEKSLVLGDELCAGTETTSAVAIFSAGVETLLSKMVTFMFATHIHEITRMTDSLHLDGVAFKHLAVAYDAEKDELRYIRKLQDGPGNAIYGLEVCRALHMPIPFTERAGEIRSLIMNGRSDSDLSTSRYNTKKVLGKCELCDSPAVDTHHLQHQEGAVDGYVKGGRMNHAANLAGMCKECHKSMHKGDNVEHRKVRVGSSFVMEPF
jgi:DNA mismatch repair protein MutS